MRDTLKQICWDVSDPNHYMDYPNYYIAAYERYEASNPEWFEDEWDNTIPFEKITDPTERFDKRLHHLDIKLTSLATLLTKTEDDDEPEFIGKVRQNLQELRNDLFSSTVRSNNSWWLWFMAGAGIFYLIQFLFK